MSFKKGNEIVNADWSPDSKQAKYWFGLGYTYVPPTPTNPPPAPTNIITNPPIVNNPPPTTSYSNLENRGGTIYNKSTNQGFSSPEKLAQYLGTSPDEIQWGNIPSVSNTVTSTDSLRNKITEDSKPYIRYEGAPEIYNKATKQHITAEEAAKNPNFWSQVQTSKTPLGEGYSTPTAQIKNVLGEKWQTPSIFAQKGLTEQGIYGAIRIKGMNDVYTIGNGGMKETPETFKAKFGTLEQGGIVNEITPEQAVKLGITVGADSLVNINPLGNEDPLSGILPEVPEITPDMTSEEKANVAETIKQNAEKQAGVQTLKENRDTAYGELIKAIKGFMTDKNAAKTAESERLGLEAKSKAIEDAQASYTQMKSRYDTFINEQRFMKAPMEIILGRQAQIRTQAALELAPLEVAVKIAEGSYDRAKGILDEWSNDYNQNFEFLLDASQANIDKISGDLTDAQQAAKDDAQSRLDFYRDDYNEMLSTQDEVKKLSLLYPEAGIKFNDKWEDAYRKASPYVKDENDLKKKADELDLKLKEAQISRLYSSMSDSSGGIEGVTAKDKSKFLTEISKGVSQLKQGFQWGEVWDRIHAAFPNVPNATLDIFLGGGVENGKPWGWATPGYSKSFNGRGQSEVNKYVDLIMNGSFTDKDNNVQESQIPESIRADVLLNVEMRSNEWKRVAQQKRSEGMDMAGVKKFIHENYDVKDSELNEELENIFSDVGVVGDIANWLNQYNPFTLFF